MLVKKGLLVGATVATLTLGAAVPVLSTMAVSAESSSASSTSLVEKIAAKFNLKTADVQVLFDEDRTTREAEREQAYKDKLATAVKDGKLTQAQADKAQAKHNEMKAEMEANRTAMKDKTDAERKAAMEAKRVEIKKWATDNGIDESYLMGDHGGRGPGGPPPSN